FPYFGDNGLYKRAGGPFLSKGIGGLFGDKACDSLCQWYGCTANSYDGPGPTTRGRGHYGRFHFRRDRGSNSIATTDPCFGRCGSGYLQYGPEGPGKGNYPENQGHCTCTSFWSMRQYGRYTRNCEKTRYLRYRGQCPGHWGHL